MDAVAGASLDALLEDFAGSDVGLAAIVERYKVPFNPKFLRRMQLQRASCVRQCFPRDRAAARNLASPLTPEHLLCRRPSRPKHPTLWERSYSGCCTCCHTLRRPLQILRAMGSLSHPCQKQVDLKVVLPMSACDAMYPLRRQHLPLLPSHVTRMLEP